MTACAVGERPRLLVDLDGGLVHLRADYDPRLVALIRKLPDRHYVAERAEWIMPARRPALAELCELIERPELEVTLSERARRRLERHGPGRLTLDKGGCGWSFRTTRGVSSVSGRSPSAASIRTARAGSCRRPAPARSSC